MCRRNLQSVASAGVESEGKRDQPMLIQRSTFSMSFGSTLRMHRGFDTVLLTSCRTVSTPHFPNGLVSRKPVGRVTTLPAQIYGAVAFLGNHIQTDSWNTKFMSHAVTWPAAYDNRRKAGNSLLDPFLKWCMRRVW